GLRMLGSVIVVGVEDDEQAGTVGIVVVAASLGHAVVGLVGVVEVIVVVGVERVMVADRGRNRQGSQGVRVEITGVLFLLGLAGLVDLVAGGNDEVEVRILCGCDFQRAIPAKAVVAGRGVGCAR